MALKDDIEAILNGHDARVRLKNALRETQGQTGDLLGQSTAIALLLEVADVQDAAILRLAEEIDRPGDST